MADRKGSNASEVHPKLQQDDNGDIIVEEEEEDFPPTHEQLMANYIADNFKGGKSTFKGPYGRKELVFCDLHQNGRNLNFIEDYLSTEVHPLLSTDLKLTTSVSALQCTMYLDEVRNILLKSTNCGPDDELIFLPHPTKNGSASFPVATATYLANLLKVEEPIVVTTEQVDWTELAPWVESSNGTVVRIGEDANGHLDMAELKTVLESYSTRTCPLIGYFPACSEITGAINEDLNITALLHMHSAIALWNYTSVAANAAIDMNPESPEDPSGLYRKDAIFFTVENFLGGLQTANIVLIKKALLPGDQDQMDTQHPASIVSLVRAGMVFQLKDSVDARHVMQRQTDIWSLIEQMMQETKGLRILGAKKGRKMAVLSFVMKNQETDLYLHHNFICSLLQDLFGIQARSVSAMEHSYSAILFGLNQEEQGRDKYKSLSYKDARRNFGVIEPGFVQMAIPWFFADEQIHFILTALSLIATDGWRLLPQYNFSKGSGEWCHTQNLGFTDRKVLSKIHYDSGEMVWRPDESSTKTAFVLNDAILKVKETIKASKKIAGGLQVPDHKLLFSKESLAARWFILPTEAKDLLFPSVFKKGPKAPKKKVKKGMTPEEIIAEAEECRFFNWKKFSSKEDEEEFEINPIGTLGGEVVFSEPLGGGNSGSGSSKLPWLTEFRTGKEVEVEAEAEPDEEIVEEEIQEEEEQVEKEKEEEKASEEEAETQEEQKEETQEEPPVEAPKEEEALEQEETTNVSEENGTEEKVSEEEVPSLELAVESSPKSDGLDVIPEEEENAAVNPDPEAIAPPPRELPTQPDTPNTFYRKFMTRWSSSSNSTESNPEVKEEKAAAPAMAEVAEVAMAAQPQIEIPCA